MREVLGGQRIAFALQRSTEQYAGQLADVAGPAIPHQYRQCVIADRLGPHARLLRKAGRQVTDERRNIAAAVAQRRDRDGGRRDPLGKAGMEVLRQRPAASCDQTDVDRIGAVASDGPHFAGGEYAIEPLLRFFGQRGNVVEQQCPAVRLHHPADALGESTGECAGNMAEQSLSMMLAATALQSSRNSGPRARRLAWWIARAKVSLPLPASPTIRIASDCGRPWRRRQVRRGIRARRQPTDRDRSGAIFLRQGGHSPVARRRSAWEVSASSRRSGAIGWRDNRRRRHALPRPPSPPRRRRRAR